MATKSQKKKLVVLTGAGMSAESGIKTFRDSGGLWEEYDIYEVATPEAFAKNPGLVLDFYNARRKNVREASPNPGHYGLVELEQYFNVDIITQNVDDLHERAGSSKVLHLHGEITRARSSIDDTLIYDVPGDISLGDHCEKGSQLRPHIVWFGEPVPMMAKAEEIAAQADIFVVIGTSMVVYPAAGLIHTTPRYAKKYVIDPNDVPIFNVSNVTIFKEKASVGVKLLKEDLLKNYF